MKAFFRKLLPNWFWDNYYHAGWSYLGSYLYGNPSKKITVIGVTGTNGKTTTCHLVSHILESAGYKVALISSLSFKVGEKAKKNELKMTIPGRLKLHKFLHKTSLAKCDFAVLEVTSEGIKQKRHKYIKFDTCAFTNIAKEHIEAHGSFDAYRKTKELMFALPHRVTVVNADDEHAKHFLSYPSEIKLVCTNNSKSEIKKNIFNAQNVFYTNGISFNVGGIKFSSKLVGSFNVNNILIAIAICSAQGLTLKEISKGVSTFMPLPGRMEVVIGEPFKVIVDYAHTPDALEKVYETVHLMYKGKDTKSRVIGVLGAAGGGRDKWKRPEFGKVASKYCNEIVLTDEDPYDEDPKKILRSIEKGITIKKYSKILDRKKAISEAMKKAKEGDIVIITGKGAEPLMMTAKGKVKWDDREIVREEFSKLNLV